MSILQANSVLFTPAFKGPKPDSYINYSAQREHILAAPLTCAQCYFQIGRGAGEQSVTSWDVPAGPTVHARCMRALVETSLYVLTALVKRL